MPSTPKSHLTLRDIARKLGVSHTTVSLALRGSPEIPEVRRAEIRAAVAKMNYQPHPAAAALARFRRSSASPSVRACLAWFNLWPAALKLRGFSQFDLYWKGAVQAAGKAGYHLEEFTVDGRVKVRRLEKILLTRNIRGILIPPVRAPVNWKGFDWGQFSVVHLGRGAAGIPAFHSVTGDQVANAILAFQKIKERGYRRVGFVGHRTMGWTYLGGFLQVQQVTEPKTQQVPPLLFEKTLRVEQRIENWDTPEMLKRFKAWMARWKPDAIITESVEVLSLVKKAGRSGAGPVGLAALNVRDLPYDAGIDQNPEEAGRVAVLALISLLNENDRGIPAIHREILVRGTWIDGASLPRRTP